MPPVAAPAAGRDDPMAANGKPHFGVNVPQIKRTWEEASAAAREFEDARLRLRSG